MEIKNNEEFPKSIILTGGWFWDVFDSLPLGFVLSRVDVETIASDILARFMQMNEPQLTDFSIEIPDINRMRDKTVFTDPSKMQNLIEAIRKAEENLYHEFTRMELFEDKQKFSYYFDRFLGKDFVLERLPY